MREIELDFETLLRYGIPGFILLLPLILKFLGDGLLVGNEGTAFLLVFIMLPVGFAVYQMWVLLLEVFKFGYHHCRPNLKYLAKEFKAGEHSVYLAWEYWLYYNADDLGGVFTRLRRTWHFYNTGMSNAVAFLLGAILAILLRNTTPYMNYLIAAYPILLILFWVKSNNLEREIDEWELYIAKQNKDEIKKVFDKISD